MLSRQLGALLLISIAGWSWQAELGVGGARLAAWSRLEKLSKMVSKKATEVHGGMGFTDLLGLHFWFKRIGLNRHILGSPEIVREEAAKVQGL